MRKTVVSCCCCCNGSNMHEIVCLAQTRNSRRKTQRAGDMFCQLPELPVTKVTRRPLPVASCPSDNDNSYTTSQQQGVNAVSPTQSRKSLPKRTRTVLCEWSKRKSVNGPKDRYKTFFNCPNAMVAD